MKNPNTNLSNVRCEKSNDKNKITTNDNFLRSAPSPLRPAKNDNRNHKLNSIFHQTSTIIHLALLFAILLFGTAFPQTIIKERVEVTPQEFIPSDNPTLNEPITPYYSSIHFMVPCQNVCAGAVYFHGGDQTQEPVFWNNTIREFCEEGGDGFSCSATGRFDAVFNVRSGGSFSMEYHLCVGYSLVPQQIAYTLDETLSSEDYKLYWIARIFNGSSIGLGFVEVYKLPCAPGSLGNSLSLAVVPNPSTIKVGEQSLVKVYINRADYCTGEVESTEYLGPVEVGMLSGCDAGGLLPGYVTYLESTSAPFYFMAANDIDMESEIVRIKVKPINQPAATPLVKNNDAISELYTENAETRYEYTKDGKAFIKNIATEITTTNNTPVQLDNPTTTCFGGTIEGDLTGVSNITVEKKNCEGEIVECNDPAPQSLHLDNFIMLGNGEFYKWRDENNIEHSVGIDEACNGKEDKPEKSELGRCYLAHNDNNSKIDFKLLDDAKIKACLDKTNPDNPTWNFNVDFNIPIIADYCPSSIKNDKWIDLIDGSLVNCKDKVKNCADYKGLEKDINHFIKGSYHDKEYVSYGFCFSEGIQSHERAHFFQNLYSIYKFSTVSDVFKEIREFYKLPQGSYPCPEDAVKFFNDNPGLKNSILDKLRKAIKNASNLETVMGFDEDQNEFICELKADDDARSNYLRIKENLRILKLYLHCD